MKLYSAYRSLRGDWEIHEIDVVETAKSYKCSDSTGLPFGCRKTIPKAQVGTPAGDGISYLGLTVEGAIMTAINGRHENRTKALRDALHYEQDIEALRKMSSEP